MRLLAAALAVAAVLAAAAARAPSSPGAAHARGCAWGAVAVRIGGATRCLVDGHGCRPRPAATAVLRRAGFACRGGFLRFDWAVLRRRPVAVQSIEQGAACPTSARTGALPGYSGVPAYGAGPAWPWTHNDPSRPVVAIHPEPDHPRGVDKVMWAIDPRYVGPVLVRGRQLDGPNDVRFENGSPGFTTEQRLNPPAELRLEGGYIHPATTRLLAPGCYAWQIDGISFSRRIVFEAVPA